MQAVSARPCVSGTADYGNALLTRFDIEEIQCEDISIQGWEPRGAICIKTKLANKDIQDDRCKPRL